MSRITDIGAVQHDGTLRATVLAPAKLNLLLAVGDKRPDGFHELVSVMQTLDLADRLDVDIEVLEETDASDVLVEAPDVPGGDTLVTRAIEELLLRSGVRARIWVTIEKEIPIGAGLGGGSSDAGAALRAVHTLLGAPLDAAELFEIAAGIGSDVPFFVLGPGRTAVVRGRGELLEPISGLAPCAWMLANPGVHQSTAAVYAGHDPSRVDPLPATTADAIRLARMRASRNDLAGPARAACPQLERMCVAIEDAGGVPLVCGSGATVAVNIRSNADRQAYDGVLSTAVPGCWRRVAWTTDHDEGDPGAFV